MIQTVSQSMFIDAFANMGRKDNFSYAGRKALYDFLEEVDPSYDLDVIALCCDYTEADFSETKKEYSNIETIEDLQDRTTVIFVANEHTDNPRIIYQVF
jgi:hypothetical protein